MSLRSSITRRFASFLALFSVAAFLAPAGASAREHGRHLGGWARTYGHTALALDPTTAGTLTSLGVSVAPIGPAYAADGAVNFPITNSIGNALVTGQIDHSGGIALSAGTTTVDLQNFVIDVPQQTLTADVTEVQNGSATSLGPVTIVALDFSQARFGFGWDGLSLGPVGASLNGTALGALAGAFPALGSALPAGTTSLPLGTATVHYRFAF